MIDALFNLLGVAGLYLSIEYCLRQQSTESLEDASLIPFADDPEVARRVELATGKKINATAPETTPPGWGTLDL